MRWLKRLFKRKENDLDFALPAYEPGESVVVFNPYVLDGMVSDEISPPRVETIYQSVYVPDLDVFAYQFAEGGAWYNESWLFPAVYGTEELNVVLRKEPTKQERIDSLLDAYRDYKTLVESFGDAEYKEKLAEIEAELREITPR
jgi:hypothetical protein